MIKYQMHMDYIKKHTYPSALALCVVALVLFLTTTNPESIAVGLLVIPVVLLFLATFCASQIVLNVLRILKREPRRKRTVAMMMASLVTVVMILRSTGGISVVDIVLLVLIVGIAGIYISKF